MNILYKLQQHALKRSHTQPTMVTSAHASLRSASNYTK